MSSISPKLRSKSFGDGRGYHGGEFAAPRDPDLLAFTGRSTGSEKLLFGLEKTNCLQ